VSAPPRDGRIITFYSYKGGTGRSMALANVGWILAATGRRVLLVDWDLEAPGLHRYLHPFIDHDKELASTAGLIDFFVDFAAAARVAHADPASDDRWFEAVASLVRYTIPVGGALEMPLEFVPAGRQDAGYGVLVTSFNWSEFYDKLGGGVFLEALKRRLRHDYDFVLIDSRTGISDTSGICTVQMPDELVVLYTLNQQSIKGAAAVAESVDRLRRKSNGEPGVRIWPVPTRVELAEKDRLDAAHEVSRRTFERYILHLPREERSRYWEQLQVLYQPYYAYEEVLATFADRGRTPNSMLSRMEAIASLIARRRVELPRMSESVRTATKAAFERRTTAVPTTAAGAPDDRYMYASYSQQDLAHVEAVIRSLEGLGIRVWYDRERLLPGAVWKDEIRNAIEGSAAAAFFIGRSSFSDWRREELATAMSRRLPIVPVLVGGAGIESMPEELRAYLAAVIEPGSTPGFDFSVARLGQALERILRGRSEAATPTDPDDPQRGRWGGDARRNGRALTASVRPVSDDYFELTLEVRSTDRGRPLAGEVEFHLHPSFTRAVQVAAVEDGVAALKLLCWGAFTVGAVADGGETTLELDLATNRQFPETFTSR